MATSQTQEKIDAILNAVNKDIERQANRSEEAFATMEKMNVFSEEYKEANRQFGLSLYVAGYLIKFGEMTVGNEPIEKIENRMRFHAYQQRTKGELGDDKGISVGQAEVAEILEGYIVKFFE